MSRRTSSSHYGVRMSGAAIALVLLSAVVLLLLLGELGTERAFGNAFGRGTAAAGPPQSDIGGATAAEPAGSGVPDTVVAVTRPSAGSASSVADPVAIAPDAQIATGALEQARRYVARSAWVPALAIYDRLHTERPDDRALAIERGRVLAWAGDLRRAAAALGVALGTAEPDPYVRLDQARFLWWAGEYAAADSVVSIVLEEGGSVATADSLRTRIRMGTAPDVALARAWLAIRPAPLEHLLLARALVGAGRSDAAIAHYRAAFTSSPAADSVMLEAATVAASVDSLVAASAVLERYLALRPEDGPVRLRLARFYAWSDRTDEARRVYRDLVRRSPDPATRFELGRLEAWAGELASAERELRLVIAEQPRHAGALKILGDLARWRGDSQAALAYYREARAADPGVEGLADGMAEAERLGLGIPTSPPHSAWDASMQGFADTEQFRWLATRAVHSWGEAARFVELAVEHHAWEGRRLGHVAQPGWGYGVEVGGGARLGTGLELRGQLGARSLGDGVRLATWGVEAGFAPHSAGSISVGYQRQPALRRSATLAALQAETVSDLVQLTAAWPLLGLDWWSRAEVERLSSLVGDNRRLAGTLAASRALGSGLTATAAAGGLSTDAPSPVLPEWGPLYWSPASFTSTSFGLSYALATRHPWHATVRAAPGYVWVREREISGRRYPRTGLPVLGAGAEASYRAGSWRVMAAADWNGSIEPGYRAAVARMQVSRPMGSR